MLLHTEKKLWASFFWGGGLEPHPQYMEVPELEVELELQLPAYATAIATQNLSHVCELYHSSLQCQILYPLSKARDWTWILMNTRRICFCCATMGTLSINFLKIFWLHPQHVKVSGPEIEPMPWFQPEPLQWQHQIINLLSHKGTPWVSITWHFHFIHTSDIGYVLDKSSKNHFIKHSNQILFHIMLPKVCLYNVVYEYSHG